jgi:nicotinamidase-related amidase
MRRSRFRHDNAVHGTRLDLLLKSNGIESLLVTGLVTEGCVEATVRDMLGDGHYPVALRDCVASGRNDLHDASLLVMSARYDVIGSTEVMKVCVVESERVATEV